MRQFFISINRYVAIDVIAAVNCPSWNRRMRRIKSQAWHIGDHAKLCQLPLLISRSAPKIICSSTFRCMVSVWVEKSSDTVQLRSLYETFSYIPTKCEQKQTISEWFILLQIVYVFHQRQQRSLKLFIDWVSVGSENFPSRRTFSFKVFLARFTFLTTNQRSRHRWATIKNGVVTGFIIRRPLNIRKSAKKKALKKNRTKKEHK